MLGNFEERLAASATVKPNVKRLPLTTMVARPKSATWLPDLRHSKGGLRPHMVVLFRLDVGAMRELLCVCGSISFHSINSRILYSPASDLLIQ